jgi:PLP dependent protein
MDAVIMPDDREAELANSLARLRRRVTGAAAEFGRRPSDVELLPVTKFFPATDVAILAELGCRSFGESREQEATAKVAAVAALMREMRATETLAWHMVGQVQRNKAKSIAAWAHTVHSVSSSRVVTALGRAAGRALAEGARARPLRVYVQLSLDGDVSRGGVAVADRGAVDALCDQVAGSPGLQLVGVMGIPPVHAAADAAFARLAHAHRRVMERHPEAVGLSAGMSGDLELAIKHGSTCVRVGTALLGQRPLTSP